MCTSSVCAHSQHLQAMPASGPLKRHCYLCSRRHPAVADVPPWQAIRPVPIMPVTRTSPHPFSIHPVSAPGFGGSFQSPASATSSGCTPCTAGTAGSGLDFLTPCRKCKEDGPKAFSPADKGPSPMPKLPAASLMSRFRVRRGKDDEGKQVHVEAAACSQQHAAASSRHGQSKTLMYAIILAVSAVVPRHVGIALLCDLNLPLQSYLRHACLQTHARHPPHHALSGTGLDQCALGGRPCSAFGVCQAPSGGNASSTCICRPDTCRPTGTALAATACACDDRDWMAAALQFQFQLAQFVAVDPLSGDAVVCDNALGNILRFTPAGRLASVLWNPPSGIARLGSVAFSPDGALFYVWDRGNTQVLKFARAGGAPLLSFKIQGVQAGAFEIYLAVEPTAGDVLATDRSNNRVVRLRADGTPVTFYSGSYNSPVGGVAVTPGGARFAVADVAGVKVDWGPTMDGMSHCGDWMRGCVSLKSLSPRKPQLLLFSRLLTQLAVSSGD
jgi:hypothetical protein